MVAFYGNIVVMLVTVSMFLATVNMNKHEVEKPDENESSQ